MKKVKTNDVRSLRQDWGCSTVNSWRNGTYRKEFDSKVELINQNHRHEFRILLSQNKKSKERYLKQFVSTWNKLLRKWQKQSQLIRETCSPYSERNESKFSLSQRLFKLKKTFNSLTPINRHLSQQSTFHSYRIQRHLRFQPSITKPYFSIP